MDVQRYIEGVDGQMLERSREFEKERAILTGGGKTHPHDGAVYRPSRGVRRLNGSRETRGCTMDQWQPAMAALRRQSRQLVQAWVQQ